MADQKISQLSAATTLTGTEAIPIVQSSATVATTPAAIKTYTNSAIPNSALASINASTTDTTNANISRNGDWGFGTTAFPITDFTSTNLNYSQIFRSVSATGGPGTAISGVAAPYDGTPTTSYLAVTPGTTVGTVRAWAGTKTGSAGTPVWAELARLTSPTFTSNLGLGGISTAYLLSVAGSLTSATTTGGINISSTVQSDVTSNCYGVLASPTTAAVAFTLANFTGFQSGISLGAGSSVTTAYGFRASSLLGTNATNAFGFYSDITSGANKYNLYCNGTAQNFMNGSLGLGALAMTQYGFRNLLPLTGATTSYQNQSGGVVQSDVTGTAVYNATNANTLAASFTLGNILHYQAVQGTFGSGSTVTNQFGFVVDSSMTGATSNYGFYGNLSASGTSRYNLYFNGSAPSYMAGSLGLGSTALTGIGFRNQLNITGATFGYGQFNAGTVQSDVTGTTAYYASQSNTTAASFTLNALNHYAAYQGTFGSGSVVTNQYGFLVDAGLTGATNNYGFYGGLAAATGRWNLYMLGTAQNYIAGNVGIGSGKTVPGFALDVNGTINGTYHAGSTATGLTAAGTNLATALALTAEYNVVSTTASGTGVALPSVTGAKIWVYNAGANALLVYPPSGTVNGGASYSLATTAKMQFVQVAAGVWYSIS
jgi:hypothetical protein